MNAEYLQALWTLVLTVACYLGALTELMGPNWSNMTEEESDAAVALYDVSLEQYPDELEPRLLRLSALIARNELDAADAEIHEVLLRAPDCFTALQFRGQVEAQREQFEAAQCSFSEAIRFYAGDAQLFTSRAATLLLQSEKKIAASGTAPRFTLTASNSHSLEKRQARNDATSSPGTRSRPNQDVMLMLAPQPLQISMHAEPVSSMPSETVQHPCLARLNTADGSLESFPASAELQSPLTDLNEAIRLDPAYALAYSHRGLYWNRAGDSEKALADYDRAIELDPNCWQALHNRARWWASKRRWREAREDYAATIEIRPSVECYHERALVHFICGDHDQAEEDLSLALELAPESIPNLRLRGLIRYLRRELTAAISDFNQALKLSPRDAEVYQQRALARFARGECARALVDFLMVDQLNPKLMSENSLERIAVEVLRIADHQLAQLGERAVADQAAPRRDRGLAYYVLERWDRAQTELNIAIDLDPASSLAWALRGRVSMKLQQWSDAIKDLTSAIELQPQDASLFSDRGQAYFELRNWTAALNDFNEALRIDPLRFRDLARRGFTWRELGDMEAAVADFNRVIASGPIYERGERTWLKPANNASPKAPVTASSKTVDSASLDEVPTNLLDAVRKDVIAGDEKLIGRTLNDQGQMGTFAPNSANAVQQASHSTPTVHVGYPLRMDPAFERSLRFRAEYYESTHNWPAAIADYRELTRLCNKDALAFHRIAWLRATCPDPDCRQGTEAVACAWEAFHRSSHSDVDTLRTLAAAYAEIGDFERAVEFQTQACESAAATCQRHFESRLKHFESIMLDNLLNMPSTATADVESELASLRQQVEATSWTSIESIETLADAYAHANDLDQATTCQEKVLVLKKSEISIPLDQVLEQYRHREPLRDERFK